MADFNITRHRDKATIIADTPAGLKFLETNMQMAAEDFRKGRITIDAEHIEYWLEAMRKEDLTVDNVV